MFSLEGKLALVTGGAGSVGRAICLALAEAGADVVVADNRRVGAENTAEKVRAFRRFAMGLAVDVTDRAQVQALIQTIPAELEGRTPDILVSNAAIVSPPVPLDDLDDARWDHEVAVNLTGAYNVTKAVLPLLKYKGEGRIIYVSSLAAEVGSPAQSSYAASKAALLGFMRSVALEGAPFHLTANAVLTGLIGNGAFYRREEAWRERMVARVPLGYAGEPRDVAALVVFLASPAARYITGAAIPVAGGLGLFNY